MNNIIPYVVSILGGLAIEAFFQLVRYRDEANNPPKQLSQDGSLAGPTSYISVEKFVSSGGRNWCRYYLFRLLPVALIMTLVASVFQKYMPSSNIFVHLLVVALVSLIGRDIISILTTKYVSVRIVHVVNVVAVVILSFVMAIIFSHIDIRILAPSMSGLIDNLWSSLIVAMLVLFYFKLTDFGNNKYKSEVEEEAYVSNYILRSYQEISQKFDNVIKSSCKKNNCSIILMYSILIYESMNRPEWMRCLERLICKITGVEMTLGIAQVKTKRVITDEESIKKATKILSGSLNTLNWEQVEFAEFIKAYNSSPQYAKEAWRIMSVVNRYVFSVEGA